MQKNYGGEEYICPNCGLDERLLKESTNNFLKPKTELKDRYVVGIALGQGGFGITYIGFDKVLQNRVAIKEYFPSDIAGRTADATVSAYTQGFDEYGKGKERFLQEARTLAKFADHACIVGVKDCFEENNTAYMVMEFLEGVSLKEYLNRKGGKLGVDESISILTPVMDALKAVHKEGIIHRDISPDNIFVTTDGRVRLIDFGAARQSIGGQKSLSVMLKPGYAPEEQYRTRANQGPWTDVYALTATFYRMITGVIPPDSLERVMEDTLEIPQSLPQNIRTAIQMGLAVRATDRFSSVEQLSAALRGGSAENVSGYTVGSNSTESEPYVPQNIPYNDYKMQGGYSGDRRQSKGNNGVIIAIVASSAVVIIAICCLLFLCLRNEPKSIADTESTTVAVETTPKIVQTAPPVFTNVSASSVTKAANSTRAYGPQLVTDGDTATAWNVTNGVNEWLFFSADSVQVLKGICILNGYTKFSPDYNIWLYYANRRAKEVEVILSDGSSESFILRDVFDSANPIYQTLEFDELKETTSVKIVIKSVYSGEKWDDCCISEVQFY